jgi:hypothetical protein
MTKDIKKRILLYGVLLLVVLTTVSSLIYLNELDSFHQGRIKLLENPTEALAYFAKLRSSIWFAEAANFGFAQAGILQDDNDILSLSFKTNLKRNAAPVDMRLLMQKLVHQGEWKHLGYLVQLGEALGRTDTALFTAIMAAEGNNYQLAEELIESVPGNLAKSELARRLRSSLELRKQGAKTILRDRSGDLLGYLDSQDRFRVIDYDAINLLQPAYIDNVAFAGNAASRLSIDIDLSKRALAALGEESGSIVLLDIATSDLIAAVSDEDTRIRGGDGYSPVFQQRVEPASIAKLLTTVAAYRNGLDPDQRIKGINSVSAKRFDGGILYNPSALGILRGLSQAMAGSCNVAFATVGVELGWQAMVEEFQRFGFGADSSWLGGVLRADGNDRQLADFSIGLEHTTITPLHAVLLAAAFGNGGYRIEPRFVAANDSFAGVSPRQTPPVTKEKIIEDEWLIPIHAAMQAVTNRGGTAAFVDTPDFAVAMKTGTGGNRRDGFHINYIGFAPVENPRIAFAVRVTGYHRSRDVRKAGYEVTKRLIRELRNYQW